MYPAIYPGDLITFVGNPYKDELTTYMTSSRNTVSGTGFLSAREPEPRLVVAIIASNTKFRRDVLHTGGLGWLNAQNLRHFEIVQGPSKA